MQTIENSNPAHAAGEALTALLESYHGKDILLLLSGGSGLTLTNHISTSPLSDRVTLSVLDERYTTDPAGSNFGALALTPFFATATERGVHTIDPRPVVPESLEDTAHRFDLALKHWHLTHHTGVVLAAMGMGADGHTAGVFPLPKDPELFRSLFAQRHRCARGYTLAPGRHTYLKRITVTLEYLTRHVAHAVAYVTGTEKIPALTDLSHTVPLHVAPIHILHALPDARLYTDLSLEER
jgi:6-phosphogluconolactonase/glucosamine-6-phosphate isomerase/deaminase